MDTGSAGGKGGGGGKRHVNEEPEWAIVLAGTCFLTGATDKQWYIGKRAPQTLRVQKRGYR